MGNDYPFDVGIETPDGIVTVSCKMVDERGPDGFLTLHEPYLFTPASATGFRIRHGDLFLIDRDRVVSVDVDLDRLDGGLSHGWCPR